MANKTTSPRVRLQQRAKKYEERIARAKERITTNAAKLRDVRKKLAQ